MIFSLFHPHFLSSPPGHYDALRPSVSFEFSQDPSVGQIALAFLQASFAYSGWNFLNYVTEEVVEPRKYGARAQIVFHISAGFHIQTQTHYIGLYGYTCSYTVEYHVQYLV